MVVFEEDTCPNATNLDRMVFETSGFVFVATTWSLTNRRYEWMRVNDGELVDLSGVRWLHGDVRYIVGWQSASDDEDETDDEQ